MRFVKTEEETQKLIDEGKRDGKPFTTYSEVLQQFREELYADHPVNLVTLPEVLYDVKHDRYAVRFRDSQRTHSVKCSEEVAQFILSNPRGKLWGFKMEKGVITSVVAEEY